MDIASACSAVCDRGARCGSDADGCVERCLAESQSGACSAVATAYYVCFGERVDSSDCASLPPECEQAWCAYARCNGQPLLPYCR
jgi:hypothetical protein